MDKSEKYILMSKKAIELQKNHQIQDGDYILFTKDLEYNIAKGDLICVGESILKSGDDGYCIYDGYDGSQYFWNDHYIWLPTQDQIQHLYRISFLPDKMRVMLTDFKQFVWRSQAYMTDAVDGYPMNTCDTMEQLWLCFWMKVSQHKFWNGKDWVQENEL